MSNTLFIFINSTEVPSLRSLQTSINKLDFKLQLDPTYTAFDDHGYSPCVLNNSISAGFEITYEPAENITRGHPELREIAGPNDYCIQLSWTSSIKDYASAMIVSCALATDYNAIVSFEGEKPGSLKKLIANTQTIINEVDLNEEKNKITHTECEAIHNSDDIKQLFEHELRALIDEHIKSINLDSLLVISISNNTSLTGKTYSCTTTSGSLIDISSYSNLRAEQIELMSKWSEEPSPEQEAQWNAIENSLDAAEREDEKAIEKFREELNCWPEKPVILKIEWHKPDTVRLYFKDLNNASISLYALNSSIFGIEYRTENYIFNLSGNKIDMIK
ncbi:hypothetical protein MNBD_GAMMA09-441 [hydrothermal vent metagenome]|uniref:Uncharacterized protein n=1 Tax=hydrothermal vent metagenome TaxID=652676 RepID=A0A3B0WY87_9ZZZZ